MPHALSDDHPDLAGRPVAAHFIRWCAHAWRAGSFGVDLFFVLSAYLITELLVREKTRQGSLNVPAFYARRILRIWPLYFFFIGLALVLSLFMRGEYFSWHYVLAYLALSGNWICALHGAPLSVAAPLWSVSVEEQFYLLWPQVVRRATASGMRAAAIGMLVIAVAVRFALLRGHATGNMLGFNTFARLDGIAIGILVALGLRGRIPSFTTPVRMFLLGFGLLGMVVASPFFAVSHPGDIPRLLGGMFDVTLVGLSNLS